MKTAADHGQAASDPMLSLGSKVPAWPTAGLGDMTGC